MIVLDRPRETGTDEGTTGMALSTKAQTTIGALGGAVDEAALAGFLAVAGGATAQQKAQVADRFEAMIERSECAVLRGQKVSLATMAAAVEALRA